MRTITLISLLIFSCTTIAQSQIVVNVASGNVNELQNAIIEAGERAPDIRTVILSTGTFTLTESGLPHIKATTTIQGHPGPLIFEGAGEGPEELIVVDEGGKLQLLNVELAEFSLSQSGTGLVQNQGELRLTKVQINNVSAVQLCLNFGVCNQVMPVIWNGENAELFLNQVSFINSGVEALSPIFSGGLIQNHGEALVKNTQVYFKLKQIPPFANSGTMRFRFTSLYADSPSGQSLLVSGPDDIMEISNSIVSGFGAEWCTQTQSLGYNFIENAECGFAAEGDRIGVSAGLLWRPVEASWGRKQQILTHALVPVAASPAIDSVPNLRCGNTDLLTNHFGREMDGNGDGIRLCDAGAVELVPITLKEGGINGIYYDPNADGHYLYILENDYNTVVMWTTFDDDGKQAWIYGTGELVGGRSLMVDAYINLDGRVSLDGEIEQAEAHRWGTLEVEMSNCNEGIIAFNSDRPGFGSGQFNITRLASVKQLGCVD